MTIHATSTQTQIKHRQKATISQCAAWCGVDLLSKHLQWIMNIFSVSSWTSSLNQPVFTLKSLKTSFFWKWHQIKYNYIWFMEEAINDRMLIHFLSGKSNIYFKSLDSNIAVNIPSSWEKGIFNISWKLVCSCWKWIISDVIERSKSHWIWWQNYAFPTKFWAFLQKLFLKIVLKHESKRESLQILIAYGHIFMSSCSAETQRMFLCCWISKLQQRKENSRKFLPENSRFAVQTSAYFIGYLGKREHSKKA